MPDKVIQEKSFEFALKVIRLYQKLREKREFVISAQLLKSGTSIGANVQEAQAAQSRKDFVAKMTIASKEARETRYWLELLRHSKLSEVEVNRELEDIESIIRILTSICKTAARR